MEKEDEKGEINEHYSNNINIGSIFIDIVNTIVDNRFIVLFNM